MAKFAFILPREEMVAPARRFAQDLGMEVVLNISIITARAEETALRAKELGADIVVARGRQASIIKETVDLPLVEIRLTGQEIAMLLHKARQLVAHIQQPRIGIVTNRNMIGDIRYFDEVLKVKASTYFVDDESELERQAEQAVADGMDVVMGGDFVNEFCHRRGWRTLFLDGTEDSIRSSLSLAQGVGAAMDVERNNTAHMQTLLAYSFNGIIELDQNGMITLVNDMACKILDKERTLLVGVPLTQLMPQEDAEEFEGVLSAGGELYFASLKVNGVNVIANAANVVEGSLREGIVFSFYEMREVQTRGARALRERYRLYRFLARGRFEDVGHLNRKMQQVVKRARTFAETTQPILLQGEVGVGKSLFAQSIHNSSTCAQGPFVTFSCIEGRSAQCEALTTAIRDAQGGTLYVDAVDYLSSAGQYVLRRLLENGVIQGEQDEYPKLVEVRVIVSLDGNLSQLVHEGKFRPDLYYILVPMLLELPPLRTRPEDLDMAINLCLDDCVTRLSRYVVLTKDARKLLMEYFWPGNYTQLKAFIERMVLTAPSRTVSDSYVKQLLEELYPYPSLFEEQEEAQTEPPPEKEALLDTLKRHKGNRSAAAAELGISKTTLWRKMKRLKIYDRTFS